MVDLPAGVTFVTNIKGDEGEKGATGTLAFAQAVSVPADQSAAVEMVGPPELRGAVFQIPRGLPGTNAVGNDSAFSTLVSADDTQTALAVAARVADGVRAAFAPRKQVNLVDYGAKFDRRPASFSTTGASSTITSSNANFTAADVGKVVFIPGAGPGGAPNYNTFIGNITSVTNSTTAHIGGGATATVTSVAGYIGTNNDSAWSGAIDDLAAGGGTIFLPAGAGMHGIQKTLPNHIRVVGAGRGMTVLHPLGAVNGFYRVGDAANPIVDVHFADFTIDGDMQTNGDGAGAKGFAHYFQRGCSFTNVEVRNTAGSGFGNDSQADTWYVQCIADNCGRIGTVSSPGHSGFGFGMGGWMVDNVYLIDCISRNNKRHGAFFEFQPGTAVSPTAQPSGAQIIGGRFEKNGITGISDQNVNGLIVLGAHIVDNNGQGFTVATTAAVDNIAVDGVIANCVITGNQGDGIDLAWTHPETLPSYGRYRILDNLVANNEGQGIQVRAASGRTLEMVQIEGNTVRSNLRNGIRLGGGTMSAFRIAGNQCYNNGRGSDGVGGGLSGPDRGGISIQTVLTNADVVDNVCGDTRTSGKSQAFGLFVNTSGNVGTITGSSRVERNKLDSNATGAVSGIGNVSLPAVVRENFGLAVGSFGPVTGTSPVTRTAGVRPEQHFIGGGTVTQITVAGENLLASGTISAVTTVMLQPGESLAVAWSAAPAWKYRAV